MRVGSPFIIILCLVSSLEQASWSAEPPSVRQAELRYLLLQDCGSCHGMTLKGGLGPALTTDALADKPPQLLLNTILDGRPGTAMPPWRGLLTADDAVWLVDELLRGVKQ